MIIAIEQAVQQTRSGTRLPEASYSDYRLGPGDVISIVVWGHPDLSSGEFDPAATSGAPQQTAGTVVSKNGTIYYPHAGEIKVAGRTIAEVRAMLTKAIGKVIENVQLEVRMADFRSQHVYVVGEVNDPGIYNITDMPMTMVDAINQAGGFTANADPGNIILTRKGGISRIDLHALYQDADLSQNILLVHGDIVNVPDNRAHKVFVMGEVRRAGSLPISRAGMTLADALSDAGNIDMATANPYHIFVVRGGPTPEIFHLSAREPDTFLLADRFPLQPRDIVYVDTADLVRWNKFVSNLLPTRNFFGIDTDIGTGGTVNTTGY
jgi:polysaccharide export outer membrane protein